MKRPSLKIIKKQIRRYGLKELDVIPCLDKHLKKTLLSWKQQGYARLPGSYFYLYKKEWDYRGREPLRDIVWAVKKKPGRKYNNNRKRRKERHRAERQRKKESQRHNYRAKMDKMWEEEKQKALVEILSRIRQIRSEPTCE